MQKKKLIWQLFPSYLVVTLLALLVATLYFAYSLHHFYTRQVAENLEAKAHLLADQMRELSSMNIEAWTKSFKTVSPYRVTVILPSGQVIADSDSDPELMTGHADRPEIQTALDGRVGRSVRSSTTIEKSMMYVAVPVRRDGRIVSILRISIPVASIGEALNTLYVRISLVGLLVALIATGLCLAVSQRISRPLQEMKQVTDRFARGELSCRLAIPDTYELASLAEGLNTMASRIEEQTRTLVHQRNEQQAVLSSMVEGVLAVDGDERIISINQAAARFLGVTSDEAQGRSIQEIVRNTDLQEFVAKAINSSEPVEGDIILHDNGGRYLQAHGTILRDGPNHRTGAVIVLNDVTRLYRLETIRRDFVANVSHELKTPVTSIKGFVETLLDGAANNPDDAVRFLKIIARQTDRLNAIIEDILSLSRIEDQVEKGKIQMETGSLHEVLQSAIELCELSAKARDIQIELDCDRNLTACMNGPLLEQAIVNLIDNAIKYSDPGSQVRVEGKRSESGVVIAVHDKGCGIEKSHQSRIFERFYRIDKARSRKLGGTGLGLAIIKHITLAHGGTVTVNSTPGHGSTFTIHLNNVQSS